MLGWWHRRVFSAKTLIGNHFFQTNELAYIKNNKTALLLNPKVGVKL